MSILIKGMKMPKSCILEHGLVCEHFTHCDVADAKYRAIDERPKGCPLVEVPTPHGRLIDADKMVQFLHHQECDSCKTPNSDECFACGEPFAEAVTDLQPTVIEAERQEHE